MNVAIQLLIAYFFGALGITSCLSLSDIVVSVNIDLNSEEIVYESFRLLESIKQIEGNFSGVKINVCLTVPEIGDSLQLEPNNDLSYTRAGVALDSLSENTQHVYALLENYFKVHTAVLQARFSPPHFATSLNKLCALAPGLDVVPADNYILYLDSDIVVLSDPVPQLTSLLYSLTSASEDSAQESKVSTDIICGRPWSAMSTMDSFFDFITLDMTEEKKAMFRDEYEFKTWETISGYETIAGMCNTGVYFMRSNTAHALALQTRRYVDLVYSAAICGQPLFSNAADASLYNPVFFGIDSIAMWAAQFALNLTITLAPPNLNYLVPTEAAGLLKFVEVVYLQAVSADSSANDENVAAGQVYTVVKHPIALAHFSKGSFLRFGIHEGGDCGVHILGVSEGFLSNSVRKDDSSCFGYVNILNQLKNSKETLGNLSYFFNHLA